MLKKFRMDLHIHTCLSPCGDSDMRPGEIVKKAKLGDLDAIGICDHNSAENVTAVRKAGERENLEVIGGIEITSREEVHILALFDREADLLLTQNVVYEHLPGTNDKDVFGDQLIVDENDRITGTTDRLLIGATTLLLEQIVEIVHRFGGLAIASHVDREAFSIIGQLGFIPEGLSVDGLEVSPLNSLEDVRGRLPQLTHFPLVTFSDAHYLDDIARTYTSFLVERADVQEIGKALLNEDGRRILED